MMEQATTQSTPSPAELEGLHEIVLPEPVGWMPQTVGWIVVLVAVLSLLAWGVWRYARARAAARYRRQALARLSELEAALLDPDRRAGAVASLPVLVKRTTLSFAPRADVASLTGEPWLRFLDRTYRSGAFTTGTGRFLNDFAYRTPLAIVSDDEISELLRLIRDWIRRHRAPPRSGTSKRRRGGDPDAAASEAA